MSKNYTLPKGNTRLNVNVPTDVYERFQSFAKRQGRTVSSLVRDAVETFIEKNELDKPDLADQVSAQQILWTEEKFRQYWGRRMEREATRMVEMKKEIMYAGGWRDWRDDLKNIDLTNKQFEEIERFMEYPNIYYKEDDKA